MDKPLTAVDLLDHIGRELKLLWAQMDAYQELFEVEQAKRAPLLAEAAPGCFKVLQLSLIDSLLMRIFRLMDRARTRGCENSSFAALRDALRSEAAQVTNSLLEELDCVVSRWNSDAMDYAGLKRLRDKDLSHNDRATQKDRAEGQLWMTLTRDEFKQAQDLAGKLWSLYRATAYQLRGVHLVEPQHASVTDRPAMLLKRLCEAKYLESQQDRQLEEGPFQTLAEIGPWYYEYMGDDSIRQVFLLKEGSGQ